MFVLRFLHDRHLFHKRNPCLYKSLWHENRHVLKDDHANVVIIRHFWILWQGAERTQRSGKLPEDRLQVLRQGSQYGWVAAGPYPARIRINPGHEGGLQGALTRTAGAGGGRQGRSGGELELGRRGPSAGAPPAALPRPDGVGSRPDRSGRPARAPRPRAARLGGRSSRASG